MKKQTRVVLLESEEMVCNMKRILDDLGLRNAFFRTELDDKFGFIACYRCDLATHNLVTSMLETDLMLEFYKFNF